MSEAGVEDPFLFCYPSGEAFEGRVREALREARGSARDRADAVRMRLRGDYPHLRIVVHAQPRSARGAGRDAIWVVFRDQPQLHRDAWSGRALLETTGAGCSP